MTTIAYDGKMIVCDGRTAMGDMICNDSKDKTFYLGEFLYASAGFVTDIEHFKSGAKEPQYNTDSFAAFYIQTSGGEVMAVYAEDGRYYRSKCENIDAIGSGREWAIAAMDHGKTAYEAVLYAATRDCKTGRPFIAIDVKTGKISYFPFD